MTVDSPPIDFDRLTDGSAKIFGMENFGNTCYCNSILQCLYFAKPFRERILEFPDGSAGGAQRTRPVKTSIKGLKPHPFMVDPNATLLTAQNGEYSASSGAATGAAGAAAAAQAVAAAAAASSAGANGETNTKSGRRMSLFGRNKDKEGAGANGTANGGANGASGANGANGNANGTANGSANTEEGGASGATLTLDTSLPKEYPYKGLHGLTLGMRFPGQNIPVVGFTDDPFATPENRKRAALQKGPIVNLDMSLASEYDMNECLFTSLKDVFESMAENSSRTGVVSPAKLIDVLKRDNELFRSSMHQDAHEFLNFLLNEVIESVDRQNAAMSATPDSGASGARWVHDLFEGLLTSETKCLTCETVSRRDEQFLDLSIDLERNSSVTGCLQQFSASEMLCERNKFHCDSCGGLQEAEKRMKVKKLPKILALHLKRFKFTEDMQRNVKLFHRVLYPKHLRLFNTTYDAEDPEKLYELCSVVVHIGGGPYHGHYVSVIKTEHAGWLLFDDEMVEAVDPNYVFNFFGDNKGMATAYVLFYQEVSPESVEKECLYTNDGASSAANAMFDQAAPASPASSTTVPPGRPARGSSPAPIEEVDEGATTTTGATTAAQSTSASDGGFQSMSGSGISTEDDLARQRTNGTTSSSQAPPSSVPTPAPVSTMPSTPARTPSQSNGSASASSSFKLRGSSFGRKKSKDDSADKRSPSGASAKRGLSFSFRKSSSAS